MQQTKFTYLRKVQRNQNGTKNISLPQNFEVGDHVQVIYDAKYNEVIVRPLK